MAKYVFFRGESMHGNYRIHTAGDLAGAFRIAVLIGETDE
jgi:hypothetical protein